MSKRFDILIVGGGHAGAEAAWAASQFGAATALITMDRSAIGRMSCNPAIGGLGKGQMVREIDALGGLMGLAIDRAGIQFRTLNKSKGPAVWAPRAQADRDLYPAALQDLLDAAPNLEIVEGSVESIDVAAGTDGGSSRVRGVLLHDGRSLKADAVVLTTGTFLRGLMHCGDDKTEGGRVGEASAVGLSRVLADLGFELRRLKTGTPPRVHRDTVHYDHCTVQPADDLLIPFSFMNDAIAQPQVNCWITWTNAAVHDHIRANLDRAPMYSGQIESTGPRYCPSIEDKVVRFADKPKHQIFLEPEGYDSDRVYCNGISTSLPQDVQDAFVRSVPALSDARILQYGYAVEYDFIPTHQTRSTLETKLVDGLFVAGQINGTSGYEEAAGQGLVAGINAALSLQGRGDAPFVPGRDEAYLGVMIDDLITKPPTEPYRMFTSRAEYRLQLRSDNADQRLTPVGRELGLVDDGRWLRYQTKVDAIAKLEALCRCTQVDGTPIPQWLKRPEATVTAFADHLSTNGGVPFGSDVLAQYLVESKYSGYVDRQSQQVERFRKLESQRLPAGVDYARVAGLRLEAREHLARVAPRTLGQAARISGISPADITVLWVYLTANRALFGESSAT